MLTVCRFMDDAPFAYSITYDEGFIDVLANAWPIHERYGIPGHLDVVAGQLGRRRDCFGSSLNGLFHMGAEHLRFLVSRGWSVGNHSYSHYSFPAQPGLDMYREIVHSKYLLEDRLGVPISHFAIPNDVHNYEPARPLLERAGYLSCQHIEGGVNYDGADLLRLGNFMLASGPVRPRPGWPEKLYPGKIRLEAVRDGWLCETTHMVQPDPIQDWKNISAADLEKRFREIRETGGGRAWTATPVDVVDYILLRRGTKIRPAGENEYRVEVSFPAGIRRRALSFRAADEAGRVKTVLVDGKETAFRRENGAVIFSIDDVYRRGAGPAVKLLETDGGERQ